MCLLWRFSAQFTQWHCNGCILLYLLIFSLYTFQSNSYLKFRFYLLVGTDTCWQMVFQQDSLLPWSLVCCLRRLLFSLGQWTMHCGYLEEKNFWLLIGLYVPDSVLLLYNYNTHFLGDCYLRSSYLRYRGIYISWIQIS